MALPPPSGSGPGLTTSFGFDGDGRQNTVTNAMNQTTTRAFTPDGQTASVTDNLGHQVAYAYGHGQELLSTTDALNHTSSDQYDSRYRLVQTTAADGGERKKGTFYFSALEKAECPQKTPKRHPSCSPGDSGCGQGPDRCAGDRVKEQLMQQLIGLKQRRGVAELMYRDAVENGLTAEAAQVQGAIALLESAIQKTTQLLEALGGTLP